MSIPEVKEKGPKVQEAPRPKPVEAPKEQEKVRTEEPAPERAEPKDTVEMTSAEQEESQVDDLVRGMQGNYTDKKWEAAQAAKNPLDAAVMATEGITDPAELGDRPYHVAQAYQAMLRGDKSGAWARPYLENNARLAWHEQYGRHEGLSPEDCPQNYMDSWMDAWSGNDTQIPQAADLNQAMAAHGAAGPQSAAPAGYDWRNQYGDDLAPRQKYGNDCGITATRAALRSMGYDVDQDTLFADAKAKGYHNGSEWTGPQNMANYINSFGGDARTDRYDPAKMQQDIADGKPVIISTDAHYFVATKYDAETNRYYVGATGSVIGKGDQWLTAEQMAAYGSATLVRMNSLEPKGEVRPPAQPVAASQGQKGSFNPRNFSDEDVSGGGGAGAGAGANGSARPGSPGEAANSPVDVDSVVGALPAEYQEAARQHWPGILEECARQGVTDPAQISYILATTVYESGAGAHMLEFASGQAYEGNRQLGNTQPGDGPRYKGRGYVQITGRNNYTNWSEKLGMDLVNNPELAQDPAVAARILVQGMKEGSFTGVGLDDYIGNGKQDFWNARRIVNGTDKAAQFAAMAERLLAAMS